MSEIANFTPRLASLWCPDLYSRRVGEVLLVSPNALKRGVRTGMKVHVVMNKKPYWWIGCGSVRDNFVSIHPSRYGIYDEMCANCLKGVGRV